MMQAKILLSIGIPTYRRPERLKNMLQAIANQQQVPWEMLEVVVSDNASGDDTVAVANSFKNILPIRVFSNPENLGPDYNFRILADRSVGQFLWFVPDDDGFVDLKVISRIVELIQSSPSDLGLVLLNQKLVMLSTGKVLIDNTYQIKENIHASPGIKILDQLPDVHLLTGIGLIVRREWVTDAFVDRHSTTGNLSPMAMALAACAKGSVSLVAEPWVILGAGDNAEWRKRWSCINYLNIPDLIIDASKHYQWPASVLQQSLNYRKKNIGTDFYWQYFLKGSHGLEWKRFIRIYGFIFFVKMLFLAPYFMLQDTKIVKRILGKKNILDES